MTTVPDSFFKTSVFLSFTIGIPFCLFKGLFGYVLLAQGPMLVGVLLLAWALLDLGMNFIRAFRELLGEKDPAVQFCILGQLGRRLGHRDLFMSVDTFLSFAIICTMLWSGWISLLPQWGLVLWLAATTVNLMSLALMNIWLNAHSLRRRKSALGAGRDTREKSE